VHGSDAKVLLCILSKIILCVYWQIRIQCTAYARAVFAHAQLLVLPRHMQHSQVRHAHAPNTVYLQFAISVALSSFFFFHFSMVP
jgi:hypothetical protein